MPTPALIVMGVLPPTRQDHLSLGRVAWHLSEALLLAMGQRYVVCMQRVNIIAIRCRSRDIGQNSLTKAGHQEYSDTRPWQTSSYCLPGVFLKDAPTPHGLQHAIGMVVTSSSCVP